MAEMLVALWLSCCKPHSPGRVNPTFKPKPRYRQPGQQQWHISNYPKTKCPSFVCNPHSGNSASQHMELCLGGLEGRVEVVLCSHLTALDCLEELRWLVVKHASVINVRSSSWVTAMTFSCFSLCVCVFHCSLFLFTHLSLYLSSMVKYRSPGSWTSKRATIGYQQHHYLPCPCESLSDQWDLV